MATLTVAAAALLERDPRGELWIAEGKSILCHLLRMSRAAALLENERFQAVSVSNKALEERLRQDEKISTRCLDSTVRLTVGDTGTGFPDDELVRHGVMRGTFELLTKPFSIDEVVERLESRQSARDEVAAG